MYTLKFICKLKRVTESDDDEEKITSWVDGQLYENGIYFICPGQFTESDDAW